MQIKTVDLKEFIRKAGFVKTNSIIPILEYYRLDISFGEAVLLKHNLSCFVQYNFSVDDLDDLSVLLNEKILVAFVNQTKSDVIDISSNGTITKLTDGYYNVQFDSTGCDISLFPVLPKVIEYQTRLGKELIDAIKIAKLSLGKDSIYPQYTCVYLQDRLMFACDRITIFYQTFNYNLPNIKLTFGECNLLGDYNSVDYALSDNYNIYRGDNVLFGFRLVEGANGFDYKPVTDNLKKQTPVIMKTADLINFCESTLGISGATFNASRMITDGNSITMVYEDSGIGTKNEIKVFNEGAACFHDSDDDFAGFSFNPVLFLPIIKALPFDKIYIANERHMVSFFNPQLPDYTGAVTKIVHKKP